MKPEQNLKEMSHESVGAGVPDTAVSAKAA